MLKCFGIQSNSLALPSTSTTSNTLALVRKSWHDLLLKHVRMAFLKKKRVKFLVDFEVNKLTDVPLLNATLFAKIRLLDGGSSFESFTNHGKVEAHTVNLGPKFNFSVRIPADASTGQLEDCKCKISVRKEDRGGRAPVKIGYVIVNLSEFAASGVNEIKQSYLLDGYTGRQRQDNSRVHICCKMIHQGADPLFKVPNMAAITSSEEAQLNPVDRKAPSRATLEAKALTAEPAAVPRTQSVAPSSSTSIPQSVATAERASWHGITSSTTTGDTTSIASSNATTSNTATSSIHGSSLPPSTGSPQLTGGVIERTTLPSSSTGTSTTKSVRRMSDDRLSATINRVQRTRHDAQDVIDEVLHETSVLQHGRTRTSTNEEDDETKNGLALFVSKDGEAVVGQNSMYSPPSLQRIHIADASLASL